MRRLDDQHIDARFRKDRGFRDRLIVEIYIAGVENCSAFGVQQNSARAKDVTRIEKFECDSVASSRAGPFAMQRDALTQLARLPLIGRSIEAAMSVERIHRYAQVPRAGAS